MMYFTRTMAAGYGCEVGDDVIFVMKWMGINQSFIAWFSSLSSRQADNTRGIACLGNAIVIAMFLLSFGGWAAEGFPMPSLGVTNGQPMCMTFNTLLCVILGVLMIFKQNLIRETFLTKEDGDLAEFSKENSPIFMFEMWKWIGMMKIGEALRNEFMFGTKDEDAKYQLLRQVSLQWMLHAGLLVFLDFAHKEA